MSGESKTLVQLAVFDRKQGQEQLRLTLEEFTGERGEPALYGKAQIWFKHKESGEWRFTGKVVTIRRAELSRWIQALQRAQKILNGDEEIPEPGQVVREHRTVHGRQQQISGAFRHPQDDASPVDEAELERDEALF